MNFPVATMQLTATANLRIVRRLLEKRVPHAVILDVLAVLDELDDESQQQQQELNTAMVDINAFMRP